MVCIYANITIILLYIVIEPGSEDIVLSLLNNDDLSWPEVETIWRNTINFRL